MGNQVCIAESNSRSPDGTSRLARRSQQSRGGNASSSMRTPRPQQQQQQQQNIRRSPDEDSQMTFSASKGDRRGVSQASSDLASDWTATTPNRAAVAKKQNPSSSSGSRFGLSANFWDSDDVLPTKLTPSDQQRRLDWLEEFGGGRTDHFISLNDLQHASERSQSNFAPTPGVKFRPVTVQNTLPSAIKQVGLSLEEKRDLVEYAFKAAKTSPYARRRRAQGATKGTMTDNEIDGSELRIVLVYIERYLKLWKLFDSVDQEGAESIDFTAFTDELLAMVEANEETNADTGTLNATVSNAVCTRGANLQAKKMVSTDEEGRSVLHFDKYANLVIVKSILNEKGDDNFTGCTSRFQHINLEKTKTAQKKGDWKSVVDNTDSGVLEEIWTESARKKWAKKQGGGGGGSTPASPFPKFNGGVNTNRTTTSSQVNREDRGVEEPITARSGGSGGGGVGSGTGGLISCSSFNYLEPARTLENAYRTADEDQGSPRKAGSQDKTTYDVVATDVAIITNNTTARTDVTAISTPYYASSTGGASSSTLSSPDAVASTTRVKTLGQIASEGHAIIS